MRVPVVSLAALALLALVLLTAIRPVWTIDPDAAAYLSLGRSLAAGDGYTLADEPHAKYPPGQPLLLAALIRLTGPEAYGVFHGALVLAVLATVVLSHALVRRLGFGPIAAFSVAACVALSQTSFDLSVRYLRTEPLFTALSLGALLALLAGQAPTGRWVHAGLAAALTVAAMATRLAGVTLLALPLLALLRPATGGTPRARAALVLVAGLAFLGAWQTRAGHIRETNPGAPDYGSELLAAEPRDLTKIVRADMPRIDAAGVVTRVRGNVAVLARACAVLLTNVDKAGRHLPVGLAALALLVLGLGAGLRRRAGDPPDEAPADLRARRSAVLYVAATLGLYLVWPFHQQERFYVPLLPLLLLFAGLGVATGYGWLARLAPHRAARLVVLAVGLAALVGLALVRSDDPRLLDRWSLAYAAMLAAGAGLWVVAALALRRGALPPLRTGMALAAPLLFALPFGDVRFREWPRTVRAFEERATPLGPIDVHPVIEQVALYLAAETPPETVVMTDVPKMLSILSGRRCVPFVYTVEPPDVLVGDADLVFSTREVPEAAAVLDARAADFVPVLELPPVFDGTRHVTPAVLRPRPR